MRFKRSCRIDRSYIKQWVVGLIILLYSVIVAADEISKPLPDEIKNLTAEQIFTPSPKLETLYPSRAKKDGVNADAWLKYKLISTKPDSIRVIYCSKDGYDLEKAAVMSLREHDFSKDPRSAELENQWLYSIVKYGFGAISDSDKANARPLPEDSPAATGCTGKIIMPVLIYKSRPQYPTKALQSGVEAFITVRVLVNEKGVPIDAIIQKSSLSVNTYGLHDAVLKSAKDCRFEPMLCDGVPMKCWVSLPYEFRISGK